MPREAAPALFPGERIDRTRAMILFAIPAARALPEGTARSWTIKAMSCSEPCSRIHAATNAGLPTRGASLRRRDRTTRKRNRCKPNDMSHQTTGRMHEQKHRAVPLPGTAILYISTCRVHWSARCGYSSGLAPLLPSTFSHSTNPLGKLPQRCWWNRALQPQRS